MSKNEDGKTDDDIKYQSITVLDKKGNEVFLILYEDKRLMLILDKDDALMLYE